MGRIGRRVYFMSNQINMLPFLLEAFAENKNLYRDIDALYMQDKYKFYKLAKLSSLYNHPSYLQRGYYAAGMRSQNAGDTSKKECSTSFTHMFSSKSLYLPSFTYL